MRRHFILLVVFVVVLPTLISCISPGYSESKGGELIVGGDDKVIILNYDNSVDSTLHIVWELKASDIINLPEHMIGYFRSIDDHKSVDNNSKILISSSSSGVVLVDRETKECLFYAIAPNAHSIEYLPGNMIAVALSTAEGGNSIELYDAEVSDKVLFRDSLYSGHGVTWLEGRGRLYALGYDQLRAYSLTDWDTESPKLQLEQEWILPETGGHDLFASSENQLLISTSESVWKFNIDKELFEPFEPIADEPDVKSVYYNEETGHLIYTKGEISWWTHNIYSFNPDKVINVPDIDVYKVRFNN